MNFWEKLRRFKIGVKDFISCKRRIKFRQQEVLGYKSILKKCIHEKDAMMMNYLVQMLNLTPEASLE